jgi:hypothetical protein
VQYFGIDAAAVVADDQPKARSGVLKFDLDVGSSRVPKCVHQRFVTDTIYLVPNDGV